MPDALTLYAGDTLQRATRWADMEPGERKRRAAEACRDRSADELWSLAEAFLVLRGRSGSKLSPRTAEAYRDAVRFFVRDTAGRNLLHLTPDEAAVWVRSMESAGRAASTVQQRLAGARNLYKALRWAGATDADPFQDVHPAKDRTAPWERRSPYRQEALDKLLAVATGDIRLVVLLGSHAGLRVSEMLALQWSDIDYAGRRILIRNGKGGKTRHAPASATLLRELESAYADVNKTVNPADDTSVISFKDRHAVAWAMRQLCERTGTQYLAVHSLRHSMGTRLYAATGKLEVVQRALGHSDISTTQIYAHFADSTVNDAVGNW